jgi:hypothetical protein
MMPKMIQDEGSGITRLADARQLQRLQLPLKTSVEDRTFSRDYSQHWVGLMNAHGEFLSAVLEYSEGSRAGSPGKWRLIRRRLEALEEAARQCGKFVGRLGGNMVPPEFKTEQAQYEHILLMFFLTERAGPFIEYWRGAVDAVEAGAELMVRPSDIPPWCDGP